MNKILSSKEKECESHFLNTTYRNEEGRFVVSIPFKREISNIGDSKTIARKRLINLEKRLNRNSTLRTQYAAFLKEYLRLGHMREIAEGDDTEKPTFYLPNH